MGCHLRLEACIVGEQLFNLLFHLGSHNLLAVEDFSLHFLVLEQILMLNLKLTLALD